MVAYGFNTKVMVSVSTKDTATLFFVASNSFPPNCFISCNLGDSPKKKPELTCGTVNMRELNQLFDVGNGNIFSSLNVIKGLKISTDAAFCSHIQML